MNPRRWPRPVLLAIVILGLAALLAIVLIDGGGDSGGRVEIPVTLPSGGAHKEVRTVETDKDNNLDQGEQQEAKDAGIDLHEDTRDETPPGVSAKQLEAGKRATEADARKELVTPEKPGGAQNYSCKRRPVVNQSGLTGPRKGVAMHFTVSNPGSLNVIFGLFNRSSFGASSNYGFELFNLKCEQWVPENRKAWAQGPANSAYVSIEIISKDRTRAEWLATPAFKRGTLAALVRDIMRRIGAPLRHVDPVGCTWPAGITDHDAIECGMTHWDVGKNFPWDVFMAQLRRGVDPAPLKPAQRRACNLLNFHRKRAHDVGRWYPSRRRRADGLKKQIPTGRCLSPYRRAA